MQTRRLGTNGPEVSVVGVGCNNFGMKLDEAQTAAVVHAALDAGITHFDTAEMYGGGKSEEFLGRALGAHRDEVVIATKFSPRPPGEPYAPGILRQRIQDACEESLRRLGTDHLDLYYQHYPDDDAPEGEALETLDQLVRDGKVLHPASSNVSAKLIDLEAGLAAAHDWAPFVAVQTHWNLIERGVEDSTVPAARRHGLGIVPYFPLASGLLTGKYRQGEPFPEGSRFASLSFFAEGATDDNFAYVRELTEFAGSHGHSVLELAIAWLAAQEGVASVIAGATTPDQVRSNAAAATWQLTDDQLASVPTRAR